MKKWNNVLEEIDYWIDKGGKEGLFNGYMLRRRLEDTLKYLDEREKGIIPSTISEEEYQVNVKNFNLSEEELLKLLESGDY